MPGKVDRSVWHYSSYKSGHTVKALLAIAPCGLITFVSRGFGGRSTDAQIVNKSRILDKTEKGTIPDFTYSTFAK